MAEAFATSNFYVVKKLNLVVLKTIPVMLSLMFKMSIKIVFVVEL